jgi:uncharacterized integral membrane protein
VAYAALHRQKGEDMFTRASNWIAKVTKASLILFFLALLLVFAIVLVPAAQGWVESFSKGTGFIDMLFSYSPDQVSTMIGSYGEAGRAVYLTFTSTADMLYPVVYSVFFGLLLTVLLRRGFSASSRFQLLNLLPFGAMVFDWLENANILILLSQYPSRLEGIAQFSSICTTLKWSIGIGSIIILLVAFVMALKNGFKKK